MRPITALGPKSPSVLLPLTLACLAACSGGSGAAVPDPDADAAAEDEVEESEESDGVSVSGAEVALFGVSSSRIELGEAVTFAWELTDDVFLLPDGSQRKVRVTLDAESDGVVDHAEILTDERSGSLTYVYTNGGPHEAELALHSKGELLERARLDVQVTGLTITIVLPVRDTVTDENVSIVVDVASDGPLASVVASAGQADTALGLSTCIDLLCEGSAYGNWLVLDEGQAEGPTVVEVAAIDKAGVVALARIPVEFRRHPRVVAPTPLAGTVARPFLDLDLACDPAGVTPCTIEVSLGDQVVAAGDDLVQTTLDLSDHEGETVHLDLLATDAVGRTDHQRVAVHVESSQTLVEVLTTAGTILDVDPERVLYATLQPTEEEAFASGLHILHRPSGAVQDVPMPTLAFDAERAQLTPTGAIFQSEHPSGPRLFDWWRDELVDLGTTTPRWNRVAQDFFLWNAFANVFPAPVETSVFLRSFSTGTVTTVADEGVGSDVTPEGVVLFDAVDGNGIRNVFRVIGGSTEPVTENLAIEAAGALTDGALTVYAEGAPTHPKNVVVTDGAVTETLVEAAQGPDYRIANGWVAYTRPDDLAQFHVWRRDPNGVEERLTFFPASSEIETLAPNGEMTIRQAGRRLFVDTAGDLTDLSSSLGTSFFLDEQWFVRLGRTLFELVP